MILFREYSSCLPNIKLNFDNSKINITFLTWKHTTKKSSDYDVQMTRQIETMEEFDNEMVT